MANKENVTKWVQALRSGEYEQTDGVLCRRTIGDKYAFCCLGVASEVAIANGVELIRLSDDDEREQPYQWHDADSEPDNPIVVDSVGENELPWPVQEWLGILSGNPVLDQSGLDCISANDERKYTFTEIADLVEARYLKEGQ